MKHPKTSSRLRILSMFAVVAGFAMAGCGNEPETDTNVPGEGVDVNGEETAEGSDDTAQRDARQEPVATAELADPEGEALGTVEFYNLDAGATEVVIATENMDAGFYGFHIHENGECEPDSAAPDDPENTGDFMSAGGHLTGDENGDHPDHAGDLPALLVNEDGTASLAVVTDRLDEDLLLDDNGSAVMIHAEADNYANIPDRYLDEDGPDEDTLNTGDAGDRLACGVVE